MDRRCWITLIKTTTTTVGQVSIGQVKGIGYPNDADPPSMAQPKGLGKEPRVPLCQLIDFIDDEETE